MAFIVNWSLLFILKQVFFLCSWHPCILLSCSELNGSKKCWDSQTSHNELTSTKWTHLFQGKFFCSQMQNFVQFLPLWSKNLFPSGVHIREISPNYNTTLLDQVLILLETFLGREVHMPPVWISIVVILHFKSWVGHVLTVFNPSLCRLCPFHVVVCCCFKAVSLWDFTLMEPLFNLGNTLPA